jgi:hypothetical protein
MMAKGISVYYSGLVLCERKTARSQFPLCPKTLISLNEDFCRTGVPAADDGEVRCTRMSHDDFFPKQLITDGTG